MTQFTPKTMRVGDSIANPQGISFDNLFDLAIANDANNSIVIFGVGQLKETGAVTPAIFLVGADTTQSADRPHLLSKHQP